MDYSSIPPNPNPSSSRRRPTYGASQYVDDFDYPNSPAPPTPPPTSTPRRKPVAPPSRLSNLDTYGSRTPHRQEPYGAPPVSAGAGPSTAPMTYNWPQGAQQLASGYNEPKPGGLVYPENFVYTPPPRPPKKHHSYQADYFSNNNQAFDDELDKIPQEINDNYRPLPPRPDPSPYPPKLQVSPYEEHYTTTFPDDKFHIQSPEVIDNSYRDHFSERPMRQSSSTQNISDHLEMPTPIIETSGDVFRPLPPTPKSLTPLQSPDSRTTLISQGSGKRPETRSSVSSMYSYTNDRPIENDYPDYTGDDYDSPPRDYRANSFSRSGTILSVQRKPSFGTLRVEADTIDPPAPPVPPPPPAHGPLEYPSPPPAVTTSTYPPIYRSRTEPGHSRPLSHDPFAPPPPPKIPLTDGISRPNSVGVARSQSHSEGTKPVPRNPTYPAKIAHETLLIPDDTLLTPITESKTFPLSSKTFQKCKEPWSLTSLRIWIQEIFGSSVSMEMISLALQGLFTHHVSTLSVQMADKLAAQVGTTWLREGVLFEPTIANTALWNPLSTLEMGFTPNMLEGVLPTLTGVGCYSPRCPTTPPGVGRCYSHLCSRTLVKRSSMTPAALPSPTTGKAADWTSFWQLDAEFLRTLDKREIKRQNVIFEFIQAEEEYVTDLNTMLNFQKQLISGSSSGNPTPIIPDPRLDTITRTVFGNVKPILDWQTKKLMTPLRERQALQGPVVIGIGDIVLEWVRGCSLIYADYAGAYPQADILVRDETSSNVLFASWLDRIQSDPASRRLPFNSFLQAPNRKIQRVLLFFDEIIKYTEETSRDRETLQKATDELREIVHECDARIAETTANLARLELDEKLVFKNNVKVDLGLKDPTRKVIHRGDVSRKSDNKLEWLDVHLILLDNFLIMTKRKRERGVERLFVSKQAIPVDLLQLEGVTDDAVSKTGKLVGTMTTVVNVPPTSLSRGKTSKSLAKGQSGGSGSTNPDLTRVTSITPQSSDKLIYPFSVTHLSSSGDTYTLYAESATARSTWVERILEAKNERAIVMSKVEPFQARIVAESVFGNPTTLDQLSQKPPALVDLSTMHRALVALRAEKFGSRTLGKAITHARVNCAKSFIAPENTDFAHQRLVAVGTDDGVYIGYLPEISGLCTTWSKVLNLSQTTQIDVLDEFGVFLVLANKELIAYSLSSVVPTIPTARGVVPPPAVKQQQPQRLSGSHSVNFFATGKLKDRMLVIYKKKSGVTSVFKALEPVVGKGEIGRRNLFTRKRAHAEFFRDYDEFFIATDCFGLFTFKKMIAIPTQKGFEVLSLDRKDTPQTIPDLAAPHMAHLARRLDGTRALGMYRITEKEFLLCYDECAIYVDQLGEVSRSKIINWHGKPRATQVIEGKYVVAFDTSFIEIWRCDGEFGEGGVSLVQIIPGRDVRLIGKEEQKADLGLGPSTGYFDRVYAAMGHPERADRQIVVELVARRF